MDGKCTCGAVNYRMTNTPLFVHACHCSWCQRETGSAFAVNAMIEAAYFEVLDGVPEEVLTPSASGKGQIILRCPFCRVALWSHYGGAGRKVVFVRVGTLVRPGDCPPDIHIFTSTKLPWVVLDERVPVLPEYYDRKTYWPAASLARRDAMLARRETGV
ncbi:MAG: GFA family protein [bacterium]